MVVVLAAVVLIVVGVVVVGALGSGGSSGTRRDSQSSLFGGAAPVVALAGGAVIVVAVGALALGAVGFGGGGDETTPTETTSTTVTTPVTATPVTAATTSTTVAPTADVRDAIDSREAYMQVSTTDSFGSPPPMVDALATRAVLRITARGFEPNATGMVEQCTVADCANPFPVEFDATGAARFQYLVDNTFATRLEPPTRCRGNEPPCVVHLRSGSDSAFLTTVFQDVAPAPRTVSVEPGARGIVDGAPVQVAVAGFTPGERVEAMLCAAPDTYGPARCGAPGPVSPFTIGANGAGRTALVIRAGRVGSAGASCGRGTTCGIVVSHPMSSVPAPVALIDFAEGPTAAYDTSRWLAGLAVAAALLALALYLGRSTDWRKPTEAETPDLDAATLTDERL